MSENYAITQVTQIAQDSTFSYAVTRIAELSRMQRVILEVTDKEGAEVATKHFEAAKKWLKAWEALRKDKVEVPTRIVSIINDMFRAPRKRLEAAKKHFSVVLGKYEAAQRQKAIAAQIEAAKKAETEIIDITPDTPREAFNERKEIKTPKTSIRIREASEITIINKAELVKAIISIQKKNAHLTLDLLDVNMSALKKAVAGKKSIPGCKIEIVSKAF